MVALTTPICDFGLPAPDFELPGTDGKRYRLAEVSGPNGLLVMFICNHCPFVKAIVERLVVDARSLQAAGIGVVAISANDARAYPEDGPEQMAGFARAHGFGFPYLYDEGQDVARAYGAVCTPDFFGYNAQGQLQYRGRFDSTGRQAPPPPDNRHELLDAMQQIASTGQGPQQQIPSIGCSIKWREDA
ncbi:thioredoxin family protein [Chitinivorax sp. PXF-14]|uniref:thioredoxin family protein n=1 Tax=Chitinivorax sp. PXF-14 TaxID=3230488 RepID=UPI00346573B5